MKKATIIFVCSLLAFASCRKDGIETSKEGIKLTISSTVENPSQSTKTSYIYSSGTTSGTIACSWEASEAITVVSIGESGITAVDNFTSTGEAGREKAEFSGIWTGGASDKVICLYPALSTPAGANRYSGVTPGSSTIGLNFQAPSPSRHINKIKDYDIMVGEVKINENKASVALKRQIAVLRLGLSGAFPLSDGYGKYIIKVGLSAQTSGGVSKLFGTHGTMAAKKSTYTGVFVADAFQGENRPSLDPNQTESGTYYYYIPLFANGTLNENDKINIYYHLREKDGGSKWYNTDYSKIHICTSALNFSPGYIYEIKAAL